MGLISMYPFHWYVNQMDNKGFYDTAVSVVQPLLYQIL